MKGSFSILKFGLGSVGVPSHRLLNRHFVPEKIPFLRSFISAQRYLATCWGGNLDRSGSFRLSDRFSNVSPTGC